MTEANRKRIGWSLAGVAGVALLVAAIAVAPMQGVQSDGDLIPTARVAEGDVPVVVHASGELKPKRAQTLVAPSVGGPVMEHFEGDGSFTKEDFKHVLLAYEKQFSKPLPISAQGETALHRSLGFDHRDRVDVALFPDAAEGLWLRHYLEGSDIPYYAFRNSVPGKATAAHIHIGPPSNRIAKSD